MGFALQKVNDLISYLDKYKYEIENEGLNSVTKNIEDLLKTISIGLSKTKIDYSAYYFADRTIQFIENVNIPESSKTANRIFNAVIKKELTAILGSEFSPPIQLQVDHNQDMLSQAIQYESLAAYSSYNLKFTNLCLSSAHYCYNQANVGNDSEDAARIQSLIEVLTTPCRLIYAKNYLLACFRTRDIPFSTTHPRFTEVIQGFCQSVNDSPSDETINAISLEWAKELR